MARDTTFAGSIVLGLNDALVEITGVLVGLTLAFQDTRIVLVAGLLTGVAASLSMAASGYLEAKQDAQEGAKKHPLKSSLYTGSAYISTTFLLLSPYFFFTNPILAVVSTVIIALCIIAGFTYYVSVARKQSFIKNFSEMAAISLSVAIISFVIGYFLQGMIGV